ncbi:chromatin modification-related protein EAF1 B-like isoform X1 [Iris pallida]|uniref:Chromatin modification-related protein EAF1 B-like isoform X1 n=1 Tax=Iris pallida TaxID=29817 RepID=A0AAX6FCX0_IRIPA|nr:chromatin modification-related protein EAF1 B-like isoform X1 [Iris pallida]
MHGSSSGVALLPANAEVDSMGGVVGLPAADARPSASPRLAEIEKAQAELRQEYDARERRKRELEFLEQGGNPLDFKLGRAASASLQSTSVSEAKGSFALANSPRGDSVESSGRPPAGDSTGREPNSADNLMLLDREKNARRMGKRGSAALSSESKGKDAGHGGVKGQAYARRNRSRTGRGGGHSGKSAATMAPSSFPEPRKENGPPLEAQAENHTVSSFSNSKPVSPNVAGTGDRQDMEIDHAITDTVKDVMQGEKEVSVSETVRDADHSNKDIDANANQVADGSDSKTSGFVGKGEATSAGLLSVPQEPTKNFEVISSDERNVGLTIPDKDVMDTHGSDLSRKTDSDCTVKADVVVGVADDGKIAMEKRVDSSSNEDLNELSIVQAAPKNNDATEKSQLTPPIGTDESESSHLNAKKAIVQIKHETERSENIPETENKIRPFSKTESVQPNCELASKSERKLCSSIGDSSHSINKAGATTSTLVLPTSEPSTTALCQRGATTTSSVQNYAASNVKLAKKVREDAILKEARIIEVNLKRGGELPRRYVSLEKSTKCHWDFVLEEMAWMANDFMQERLWKTSVAVHICHQVASASQRKFEQKIICQRQQNIARTLAISVMNFWHSADLFRTNMDASSGTKGQCTSDTFKSCIVNGTEEERGQDNKHMEGKNHSLQPAIQAYAVRFLKYDNDTFNRPVPAQGPTTPDRIHDEGVVEMSWEDQLSEEILFYTVPPGAMQAYREAVESRWVTHKKMGNSVHQEDCDASICDSVPDGPREYVFEEEEGETGSYFLPGAFEGSLSSKFTHKKRKKSQQKSYAARLYDAGADLSYDPCLEGTSANQGFMFVGKRPSSSLNVCSIPTKRVRTAARQRIVSPFSAGVSGTLQVTSKTDISSGDTNSFQDDQSSMHGGTQARKNMEVESTVDFEKKITTDGIEISTKSKKKKKSKHGGYTMNIADSGVLLGTGKGSLLDQRLQVDSMVQHEQRDHVKKRLEGHHFESNGNIGIYVQPAAKKPKHSKQLIDPSPDVIMPGTGSMTSPAASQMSNMSTQNKLIKITANRGGRKNKAMKMAVGQSGTGIPWTNFEDQALVVLVHDMGPNWELVTDAINSTLQFKCIFRKPKDCKERHKYLMDKSAGDGADSAEDSGSSQPYPSTLPGIPKARGSARQLFQRLQGPIEEDVLKTHFEKIILIGQLLHSGRSQNDKQEKKQLIPVHSSHLLLSQTCPNGSVLTPLDLCDATTSSSDILTLGYQGSHTTVAAIPSQQGHVSPVLSTSGVNNVLQGSSGIVISSNLVSPSTPTNAPARDVQRYCMPRTTSLPVDDQQRMQYGQMLSSRNVQQSSLSAPVALPVGVDRGVRMLPGANGVGMMSGRTMPMPRPGFQGPSGMLNMVSAGSMLTGSGVGMPNSVNVHPNSVHGSVNPMMRPRDGLQMLRPSQNTEDHRQMIMQDLQMQVSQGSAQAVPPFNGMSAPFSTATGVPSVQAYPAQQHPQSHQMPQQPQMLGNPHHPQMQGTNHSSAQQQAYAIRFAKDRQQQQRMLPQSQQPYTNSSTVSPVQNSSQLQQQTQSSSSVTPTPSSQAQHNKQHMARNLQSSSGMSNPMMKQRQRPQAQQQQPRQHQQKPLMQHKHMKVVGRGNMMAQNVPVDPSQASGISVGTRNQLSEKPVMQQGQGFFSGSTGLNPTLTHSSNQNKLLARPPSQSAKQMPALPSNPDTCSQGPLQVSTNHSLLAPQQPPLPTSMPLANPPLQQQQQRQMNHNMQRMMLQQNRPLTSDGKIQAQVEPIQANQILSASPHSRCADPASSASVNSSASQWKPEPPHETSTPTPTAHLAGSPQESLAGSETTVLPSTDELAKRQFAGSVLPHGHGVGGQWQQQQQQAQHRQTAQGNSRPSNSGTGS